MTTESETEIGGFTSLRLGKPYLFQTVTHYYTGRVVAVTPTDIVLDDAAWIPDTGRLNECIANSTVNECEPLGNGFVLMRGPVISAIPWRSSLPTKVK